MDIKRATYKGRDEYNFPKDAEILSKEVRIEVEEIENGFLITKNSTIKYVNAEGNTDWAYPYKKYFSKTNPLKIEAKSLADKFD